MPDTTCIGRDQSARRDGGARLDSDMSCRGTGEVRVGWLEVMKRSDAVSR